MENLSLFDVYALPEQGIPEALRKEWGIRVVSPEDCGEHPGRKALLLCPGGEISPGVLPEGFTPEEADCGVSFAGAAPLFWFAARLCRLGKTLPEVRDWVDRNRELLCRADSAEESLRRATDPEAQPAFILGDPEAGKAMLPGLRGFEEAILIPEEEKPAEVWFLGRK